jgi:hypothetical protein
MKNFQKHLSNIIANLQNYPIEADEEEAAEGMPEMKAEGEEEMDEAPSSHSPGLTIAISHAPKHGGAKKLSVAKKMEFMKKLHSLKHGK